MGEETPVIKPQAKPAADRKTPAKGAAAVVAKPVPAAKVPAKKPVPAKPVAKSVPKAPAKTPAKTAAKVPEKAPEKTAAATKAAAVPSPIPQPVAVAAAPASNRFTDRFAPARPTKRPDHVPMEVVKPAVKVDPKIANAWKSKAGRDLTEEELLAMPESEYMGEKQLEFFRTRLQAQKDDLLNNAGETTEHLREDTTIVPDPADRATIEEEHALELRTRDRERKLLKKIAQSLARLDSGDYGYCDETGEPIGLARLLARPTATLSLEAQQRRELKQKMFGD